MSESKYEVHGSKIYYFLCRIDGTYHTLFIGFLRPELIHALTKLEEGGQAYVKIRVGEHIFCVILDCPLYLLEYENSDAHEFASDDRKLELFPSRVPDGTDLPPVIDFPTSWTAGIEPMLEFKLGGDFCANENGVWVPLDVEGSTGPL